MTDEQKVAMRKGSERPYYACRWVCQRDASQCFGYFTAKDVGTYPCPLAEKCLTDKHPNGQLERKFYRSKFGRLKSSESAAHWRDHHYRLKDLRKAFLPEKEEEIRRKRYVNYKNKTGKTGGVNHSLSELIPGYVPLNIAKASPPPPCGGDCEQNCPYDGVCKYPNWDDDHGDVYIDPHGVRHSRESIRRKNAKRRDRIRKRLASDPVFAEAYRAGKRKVAFKHWEKVKFVKSGGTPEGFEALWAEAGGDPEEYKKLLKRKGDGKQWT